MAFSSHHYPLSSNDQPLDIQHRHFKLPDTAPSQIFHPIEGFLQPVPMGPAVDIGSTSIGTQFPGYPNPVVLGGYPQIQTSGQWNPYHEQALHPVQASEMTKLPDTRSGDHTPELVSKAPGPRQFQTRGSPRDHCNQSREERDTSEPLRCEWKDCEYLGTFTNEGTLVRHVRTVHVSPNRFNCTICGKRFGRKDRYRTHCQMAHPHACARD